MEKDRHYQGLKKGIDRARGRLRHALDRRRSVEIRRAYVDMERAIGRALEFVERRVRLPYRTSHPPPRLHLDPFAAAAWHRELETLRDAREDLRFMALDDPHYGIPAVVVGTRGATGPELAGLRTREHGRTSVSGEGMGIDLESVVEAAAHPGSYPGGVGSGASGQSRTLAPRTAA